MSTTGESIDLRSPADRSSRADRSDPRLRAAARATSLALVIKQADDTIDLDDRYRQLTGLPFDRALQSVHPEDRTRTLQAVESGEAAIALRLLLAEGSVRHVEFRCVRSDEELVIAVIDNEARADTPKDLAHLEAQAGGQTSALETTVSDLADRNADLDSFVHTAAHDLKAPLRSLAAYSELAAETIEDEHPARFFLTRIEQSSARMIDMVDSLLQLASAGSDALVILRCDVASIIQQTLMDLDLEIEEASAVIEMEELDPVFTDPVALSVILTNVIANSIKYRSNDPPVVSISTRVHDDFVTITVSDNGIGFDQGSAEEIFEPFRRLHGRDRFEGNGIGLAICHRLVSRLDGKIWAESSIGDGATVSIRLPSAERD